MAGFFGDAPFRTLTRECTKLLAAHYLACWMRSFRCFAHDSATLSFPRNILPLSAA